MSDPHGFAELPRSVTSRFRVERCIGQGATGRVYAALDTNSGARVALKTLLHVSPRGIYRLKHEFRALAHMSHPNFVAHHELINLGGLWFITMELIDGKDFVSHVRQGGRLDLSRLVPAIAQLADALSALHEAGRVHLDVKPSNVLVGVDGRVALLDFELARERELHAADDTFDRGAMNGTPDFIAPELVLGRPPTLASDWYSFGSLLYVALTGCAPFSGDPSRVLIQKCTVEPVPPSLLDRSVPTDLERLCIALLRRDPDQRPTGKAVLDMLGVRAAGWSLPSMVGVMAEPPPRLVGRDQQLAELWTQFELCRKGEAISVYLTGRSGMGKTSLAQAFLERLRRGGNALLFTGRCYERESVPFKAFDAVIDALSRYLGRLPENDLETLVPPDYGALARVFPVLQAVHPGSVYLGVSENPDVQESRRRAFDALRELLTRLAVRLPLVIWIDDLQWGDRDSALLLSWALRTPEPPRVLFIGSFRSEEDTGGFLATMRIIGAVGEGRLLSLEPLGRDDARALARALLGDECQDVEAKTATIVDEAGGSPFFINELAQSVSIAIGNEAGVALGVSLDLTLDKLILGRVQRLPAAARALIETLCVAGRPVVQGLAIAAAGLRADASAAVATLRVAHLARTHRVGESDVVQPYHDRIAEAVVASLDSESLRARHRGLVAVLEKSAHPDSEMLAVHYCGAGELEKAGEHAEKAADQAATALAFDQAASLYGRALELRRPVGANRERLAVKLGDALANAGRGQEAARVYLESAETASAYLALELRRRAGEQLLRYGHIDEGLATVGQVLDTIQIHRAKTPTGALLHLLSLRLANRLRGLRFEERNESEVPMAALTRIDVCWSATVVTGMVDNIRGAEMQGRHLALALATGEPYRICRALCIEAVHVASEGQSHRRRFDELVADAVRLGEGVGHPHAAGLTALARGMGAWVFGEWKKTLEQCEHAERVFRERCSGAVWETTTAQICMCRSLTMLGRLRKLAVLTALVSREARDRGDRYAAWAAVSGWPMLGRLARGELAGAKDEIARVFAAWSHESFSVQHHWACLADVLIDLYGNDPASAYARIAGDVAKHRRSLLTRVEIIRIDLNFLLGTSALALGQRSSRSDLLAQAARCARGLARERVPWATPLGQLIRGGVTAARGQRELANVAFADASRGFEAADMPLFAAVSDMRRGQLLGGDDGSDMILSAEQRLRDADIVDVHAFARTLSPF